MGCCTWTVEQRRARQHARALPCAHRAHEHNHACCDCCAWLQSYGVCGSSIPSAAAGGDSSSSSSSSHPIEVEGEPGLSLSLVSLPGCELSLVHTLRSTLPSEGAWWVCVLR
jgi:hypothetical protein